MTCIRAKLKMPSVFLRKRLTYLLLSNYYPINTSTTRENNSWDGIRLNITNKLIMFLCSMEHTVLNLIMCCFFSHAIIGS